VIEQIATLPYENLDFAKIDHHRSLRNGLPEVIYGKDKTKDQLISIIKSVYTSKNDVLVTKLNFDVYKDIRQKLPLGSTY
ncbi:uncharacterized protein METZ01_LOCUS315631, partial [marine metagenome]